jgi:ribosomal protein S27E
MPSNDPAYQKAYRDKHYADNKQRYIDQTADRKLKLKLEIWELKRVPCMDCGNEFNPWQMHFDHRPSETKLGNIATMVANCQRKKVFEEIKKCDVVCANCHADRTYFRHPASVV